MPRRVRDPLTSVARETNTKFMDDDLLGEAVALSYYTLSPLVPLLPILVGVACLFEGLFRP
jgi:uncharacterized BrkB/YihY/UPF0761 family membrane protein